METCFCCCFLLCNIKRSFIVPILLHFFGSFTPHCFLTEVLTSDRAPKTSIWTCLTPAPIQRRNGAFSWTSQLSAYLWRFIQKACINLPPRNNCVPVRRAVTLSAYIGMVQTFSSYECLKQKDPEEAERLSNDIQNKYSYRHIKNVLYAGSWTCFMHMVFTLHKQRGASFSHVYYVMSATYCWCLVLRSHWASVVHSRMR